MTDALAALLADMAREARRLPFDVCRDTYAAAGRDVAQPILLAGSLTARWCCMGRELGRDEVLLGEPLVGASGRRLRRVVHETLVGPAPASERRFARALDHVLLTNLVPYRPVGNRAYDRATLARFRPFVERLLAEHWTGRHVLALGLDAFRWFAPYAAPHAVDDAWTDAARRFTATLPIEIGGRALDLAVLPHPSPLSPFKAEFAPLLRARLSPA
jgi:uracil-DNA glycosylase